MLLQDERSCNSASRTATGSYLDSFVIAGFVAVVAAFLALMIGTKGTDHAAAAA